jgi:riboflavin synthase
MFTGLIQAVCKVKSAPSAGLGSTANISIDLADLAKQSKLGDSIAINGVCLTLSELAGTIGKFALSKETLEKSTLASLQTGSNVNVELALKIGDRLGGHFVQGHIDGTAVIKAVKHTGDYADIEFAAGKNLLNMMVEKGSVAVDGISLTIAKLNPDSFSVAVIPETLARTTLKEAKINQQVNIETDIIVKAVKRHLEVVTDEKKPLTIERLKELGF